MADAKKGQATYVALLRGINVGGNNIILMADLKACFESLGLVNVRSFIQSGNVLFDSPLSASVLEKRIEAAVAKRFNYHGKIALRSAAQLKKIVADFPKLWKTAPAERKCNVIFLRAGIDRPGLVKALGVKPGIDELSYKPGVLYWSVPMTVLTRSAMVKLSLHPEYQEMTIRNVNTTLKLLALMSAA